MESKYIYKLVICPETRLDILRYLHRVNITYASLFPGIDGFARSLGTNVECTHTGSRGSKHRLELRRPLLAAVEHGDQLQAASSNPVRDDEGSVRYDKLTGSDDPAGPANLRMRLK